MPPPNPPPRRPVTTRAGGSDARQQHVCGCMHLSPRAIKQPHARHRRSTTAESWLPKQGTGVVATSVIQPSRIREDEAANGGILHLHTFANANTPTDKHNHRRRRGGCEGGGGRRGGGGESIPWTGNITSAPAHCTFVLKARLQQQQLHKRTSQSTAPWCVNTPASVRGF